jgi:ATP-dependent Clp protease ATP-binding subunit ClpC
VFRSLSREDLRQIVDLLLDRVAERLEEQQIALQIGDDVREVLMQEGYDEAFGARPLRRAIQNFIDDALADAILNGALMPGQTAHLSMRDNTVQVEAGAPVNAAA